MPTKRQWKALGLVLTYQEKILIAFLSLIIIITAVTWWFVYYFKNTEVVPAFGGEYKEAIVGEISLINPLLAQTDADRDLVNLIFSGLMKYAKNGELIGDLAESYEILDNGETYIFRLKKAKWHDGENVTANDIIFTIQTAQNTDYKSPERLNWHRVKLEKIDELTIKFILEEPYALFLENATISILPRHIFQDISPRNFSLSKYNLEPIGNGPYKYKSKKNNDDGSIRSYTLEANLDYYNPPLIKYLTFIFVKDQKEAIELFQKKEVQGVNFISADNKKPALEDSIKRLRLPIYYAVFFNQAKNEILSNKDVRLALTLAINKEDMINKVVAKEADIIHSPFMPFQIGYTKDIQSYPYSPEEAKSILERNKVSNLELTLSTFDLSEAVRTAEIIKESWEKIGIKVNLDIKKLGELLQDFIRPRNYQVLLFPINLHLDPEPFTSWHSLQKRDPGLNFALYDNPNTDKLLLEARQIINKDERSKKYIEFQKILIDDLPAIFLYSPTYLYILDESVRGFDLQNITLPSKRFIQIEEWNIKTKRIPHPSRIIN